jgi:uncharacterized membrane protein
MIMKIKLIIMSISVLVLFACKHDPFPVPAVIKNDSTLVLPPCSPDSSYFYNNVVPILTNSCAFSGCHSPLSLANYNDIINIGDVVAGDTVNSYIYKVLTSTDPNERMPPPPRKALSDSQKQIIAKWILQGAKPNACNDCNENDFKFNANVLPIIVKNCQGCHSAINPAGGISFSNYFQIKAQADKGKLIESLRHQTGAVPMPPSGKMPNCQITVIQNWINNGAQND